MVRRRQPAAERLPLAADGQPQRHLGARLAAERGQRRAPAGDVPGHGPDRREPDPGAPGRRRRLQRGVLDRPTARRAPLGRVGRGRGDLQRPADRLDPPPTPVAVDEGHDFGSRGSSSRAKNAEAARRISFARRGSRFSRSSSASRRCCSVGIPGRRPPATSACLTHVRWVSVPTPSWRATRTTTPWRSPVSAIVSRAIRTARAFSSGGYRFCDGCVGSAVDPLRLFSDGWRPSGGASRILRGIQSSGIAAVALGGELVAEGTGGHRARTLPAPANVANSSQRSPRTRP